LQLSEFWGVLYISLTTWFRDYLYIPLGGSRVSQSKVIRNTFIIFLVSGLWHGANWTFVAWGGYHAMLFLPLILLGKNRRYRNTVAEGRILPSFKELLQMLFTFFLAVLGWILFRSNSIGDAWLFLQRLFSASLLTTAELIPYKTFLFIIIMIIVEWVTREKAQEFDISNIKWTWVRYVIYYALVSCIILYSAENETFIYFQF
jgi:D-alanyl-lipoteichoic acid acyltransferase DltB (MBOAT superfamily)